MARNNNTFSYVPNLRDDMAEIEADPEGFIEAVDHAERPLSDMEYREIAGLEGYKPADDVADDFGITAERVRILWGGDCE